MGQTIGRAPLPLKCKKFLNLPRSCIYDIWEAFNDIAEGFGLTAEEFHDINKSALMEFLGVTEKTLNLEVDAMFKLLDDDSNNLVDSLEFISSYALLSGMTVDEKLKFIFSLYDFDESTALTLDEMVLAFRSSLSGVAKIAKINPPTEAEIEAIIIQAFDSVKDAKTASGEFTEINRDDFLNFCRSTPEILSWVDYFDDLEEYDILQTAVSIPSYQLHQSVVRNDNNSVFMNPEASIYGALQCEKNNLIRSSLPRSTWQNVVTFLAPSKIPDAPLECPPHNVTLDWVYGYNGFNSRQNVSYSAKGEVLYPAAAVCVIMDVQHQTQRHYLQHKDNISCLKSYTNEAGKTIVATGDFGQKPSIYVWECESLQTISVFKGFHSAGVYRIDFSPNRTKLVSVGMDPYHSVAVYDLTTNERIFGARSTTLAVYDLRFLSDDVFASCGDNHIYFWRQKDTTYKMFRGLFGSAVKPETLYCVAMVGNVVVTGSVTGMIYIWEGRNLISSVKGHSNAVVACYVVSQGNEKGLVTACSGGKIQVWNSKIEIGATFNAVSLGPIDFSIVAICWDLLTSKILIGFKSCEIFEMDATDGRNVHRTALVSGHYHQKIAGISVHPFIPRSFCSVGYDKTVRVFDAEAHKQLRCTSLDTIAYSCSYTPDGQMIIIGLGSGIEGREERKEGGWCVISEEDLTLVHEARDTKLLITDVRCSQNGDYFALSSADGSIYLYNLKDYSVKSRCRGHSGKVIHVDISSDGRFLQTNSTTQELLFWDVAKGEIQAPRQMKEVLWETNGCVYSYPTQGCWGPVENGVYITKAARSNARDLLCTVDNYGKLKFFNTPAIKSNPNYIQCNGHGPDVQNVKFSCDDSYVFTSGGTDGCIMQWRVNLPEFQDYGDLKKDETLPDAIPYELKFEGKALDVNSNRDNVYYDRPVALCELEEGTVDGFQILPWQKVIVPPNKVPLEDNSEPPDKLEIEFVYGFTCDRTREGFCYLPNGEVAFFGAAVAVIMSQKNRGQRFYMEHNTTICSLDANKIDPVAASGDLGATPYIRVWRTDNLKTIGIMHGFHRRGVAHLKFSPNGKYLASVGMDEFHSIAVYEWRTQTLLSHTSSFSNKSLWIEFNPSNNGLVHCGNEIIRFWDILNKNMTFQDALLGRRAKLQGFLCAAYLGNNAIVGTADGNLYRFVGKQLDGVILAHSASVNSIKASPDEVATASSDGFVKIWSAMLECRLVIDMKSIRSISVNVRAIGWHIGQGKMILGTSSSEIFEVSSGDGENMHTGPLLEGHGGDELWGLAVNPVKEEFCTVGDDALLRVWDVFKNNALATIPLEMPARCCSYSPDGRQLVIGYGAPKKASNRQYDGKWVILETNDYQILHEARDSTKWIIEIKYSPSGNFIAMGCNDNKIYVYNVEQGYALSAVIGNHQAPIVSFDFSEDSAWLQSCCSAQELFFFETDTGMYIPAPARLRDTKWATQNCPLGWGVQGIWPPYRDGTEITATDCNLFRNGDGPVICCGDNYGRIGMFRYPSTSAWSHSKRYKASSSSITRLRFCNGDAKLISLHGQDKIIIQWTHKRDRDQNIAYNIVNRKQGLEEDDDDVLSFFGIVKTDANVPVIDSIMGLTATRPWVAAITVPSNAPKEPIIDAPDFRLFRTHIIGCQSQATRSSVRLNCLGQIIFPNYNIISVFNKRTNSSIFYEGHAGEISCIGVSKDGKLAASAERCNRPQIHIWDAVTASLIIKLPFYHRRGVSCIVFSKDRKRLISAGMDQDHSLALWESPSGEWHDCKLIAQNKGDVNPVLFVDFYEGNSEYVFVSGGRFHQKFWTVDGRFLNSSYGEYSEKQKVGTLLCGCTIGNMFVSGSTSGHMYVWVGRKLDRVVRAHELGISAIWSGAGGLVTCSKDGMIKLWSSILEHVRSFSLSECDVPPLSPKITSADAATMIIGGRDTVTNLLVSTTGGEIFEISAKSGAITLMQEGHYSGELWGLCVHPKDPDFFATCGDDNTVRLWCLSKKRLLRKAILDCTARCIAWSEDGRNILVGMGGSSDGKRLRKDGAFVVLDAKTLKPLFEGRDSRHWIRDVRFSPDGKFFAVASMDHKIYLYNRDTFRLKGTCDRHNSYIQSLDYSADSIYIQSDSGDYEHLYYEAEDGEYFPAGSRLKDIEWHEWTCTYGYPVQGIWPPHEQVTKGLAYDPSSCHRSKDKQNVVVGNTNGELKLFKWPCVSKEAEANTVKGHVGEVGRVRFTCDGSHIISIGKLDRSISIWKVVKSNMFE